MTMRRAVQALAAIVLVAVLIGGAPGATPVGANAGDVYLAPMTMSKQHDLGGCKYKLMWGNFGPTVFASINVYNPTVCGGALVSILYWDGTAVQAATSSTVAFTPTDGCGTYEQITVTGGPGTALRALIWTGTGSRWYAVDGTTSVPGVTC